MFSRIYAQDAAIKALKTALVNDRLAHAYLFHGPGGVGKTTSAMALAHAALCEQMPNEGCGECLVCRRISAGQHPDVRVISPRAEGGGNLKVDFIREEILPFSRFAPFEGRAAFLVFPEAERSFPPHQSEAANALLKTLEEPRSNLHFVLVSDRPKRLLPTIQSRCQSLRFGRLPNDVLKRILAERLDSQAGHDMAIALADGCAHRALWLAEEGRSQALAAKALNIDATLLQGSLSKLLDLAAGLYQDEQLNLVLTTLAWLYRDLSVSHVSGELSPLAFGSADISRATAYRQVPIHTERMAQHVVAIRRAERALERTVNKQLAIEALLFELAQP